MKTRMEGPESAAIVDRMTYSLILVAGLLSCLETQLGGGPWGATASLGLVAMIWAARNLLESYHLTSLHS